MTITLLYQDRKQDKILRAGTSKITLSFQVLIPPKDLSERLGGEGASRQAVMGHVTQRVEWEKHQERLRKKDEEERERERGRH